MAPLALTLALLAMTVATTTIEAMPMDMAENSFDDQYRGCGPAMTAVLPALNRSEFQQNSTFAKTWVKAAAEWQRRGSPVSPLSSPAQAIALMAYTMEDDLYHAFNDVIYGAGYSPQRYRDNFHFKTFHFLLTDALAALRNSQNARCHRVNWGASWYPAEAQPGDTVRFGQFVSSLMREQNEEIFPIETMFEVKTCYGADIQKFSSFEAEEQVLIPPYETFMVTEVTKEGNKTWIHLHSTGTFSKYNCEWLKGDSTGGSTSMDSFHLGGFLLATTALAVATGIL